MHNTVTSTAGIVTAVFVGGAGGSTVTIGKDTITGTVGDAIAALNFGPGAVDVTVGTGAVISGNTNGIDTIAASGKTTIDVAGTVSGANVSGITASSNAGDIAITTKAGGSIAASKGSGISAFTNGGNIAVTTGDTIGTTLLPVGNLGINAKVAAGAGTVDVKVGGAINSNNTSVHAETLGTGNVTVTALVGADIKSFSQQGIEAFAQSGKVQVTAADNIDANAGSAIFANTTTGDIKVDATGALKASAFYGVIGQNTGAGTGAITINAEGNIDAGDGLAAFQNEKGVTTVNYGTGAAGALAGPATINGRIDGIFARSADGTSTAAMTINVGDAVHLVTVNGNDTAIFTQNLGSGALGVNLTAKVALKGDNFGVFATNTSGATNVTTGAGDTVTIDDALDTVSDGSNSGIFASSGAKSGTAVDIEVGANNVITIADSADGDAQFGTGINGASGGLGSQSVKIVTGAGLNMTITGNDAMGIVAKDGGTGSVNITTGTGTITINAGALPPPGVVVTIPGNKLLDVSYGILGYNTQAAGGLASINIDNAATIKVSTAAGGHTFGIYGATQGNVTIKDSAAVTSNAGDGIVAITSGSKFSVQTAEVDVATGALITSVGGTGIRAVSTQTANGVSSATVKLDGTASVDDTGGDGITANIIDDFGLASVVMTGVGGTIKVEGGAGQVGVRAQAGDGDDAGDGGGSLVQTNTGRTITVGSKGGNGDVGILASASDNINHGAAAITLGDGNIITVGSVGSTGATGLIASAQRSLTAGTQDTGDSAIILAGKNEQITVLGDGLIGVQAGNNGSQLVSIKFDTGGLIKVVDGVANGNSGGVEAFSTGGGAVTIDMSTTAVDNNDGLGIGAITSGGIGAVSVTSNGAIKATADGIDATNLGTGAVTVNYGTTVGAKITAGPIGINAVVNNVASAANVNVNIGNGVTPTEINAKVIGVEGNNIGTGGAIYLSNGKVFIDPDGAVSPTATRLRLDAVSPNPAWV